MTCEIDPQEWTEATPMERTAKDFEATIEQGLTDGVPGGYQKHPPAAAKYLFPATGGIRSTQRRFPPVR